MPYPYQGFANYANMALAPFPQITETWGPLYVVGVPKGSSDYQSLQLQFTRRSNRGWSSDVSYTLSRARGNADNAFEQNSWWATTFQDATQLDKEAKAVLAIDQTHILKGNASWDLPFGRNRYLLRTAGSVLNCLVGGWTLSGVFRYSSGQPIGVSATSWSYMWWATIYANVNTKGDFSRKFNGEELQPRRCGRSGQPLFRYE